MCLKLIIGATYTCLAVASFSADATLIGRLAATPGGTDYQAYYDDVADLTWLADAKLGGFITTWAGANTWAAGLTIGGVGGWRLPVTLQPDASCEIQAGGDSFGFNCTGSEMGNLFYNVLGGSAGSSITTTHNANYDLFSNVQSDWYWSATEYPPNTGVAWNFFMNNGLQDVNGKLNVGDVWAVHSGDVEAVSVPEPSIFALMGLGLAGLGFSRKKK